jgi:pimeloyl-ACP methyl ester carboxylesterase
MGAGHDSGSDAGGVADLYRRGVRGPILLAVSIAIVAGACADVPDIPAAPVGADASLAGGVVRRDLRFPCGETECAAWLFLPPGPRAPVVVMGHGFAGTRDVALPAFALHLAQHGLAVLVFDYRHFGASGGAPRQLVDPARQLEDWRAALAFGRGLDGVDGDRVALFGTSLGAGHALITAADDATGVRAVVAQVPLVDSRQEGDATFYGAGWLARLLLTGWADLASETLFGRTIEMPAIAPAGGFGMIVDDAAWTAFSRLVEPGSTYRNAVAAHSPFTFDDWNPAPRAAALRVPLLLVASRADRFAPFAAVETLAAHNPHATVAEIEGDHFDVYSPPVRDRALAAETPFLTRHLGVP